LEKIFVYEPEKRISPGEALQHPYFADLPFPREQEIPPNEFDWSFKLKELSTSVWRGQNLFYFILFIYSNLNSITNKLGLVIQEIMTFHNQGDMS